MSLATALDNFYNVKEYLRGIINERISSSNAKIEENTPLVDWGGYIKNAIMGIRKVGTNDTQLSITRSDVTTGSGTNSHQSITITIPTAYHIFTFFIYHKEKNIGSGSTDTTQSSASPMVMYLQGMVHAVEGNGLHLYSCYGTNSVIQIKNCTSKAYPSNSDKNSAVSPSQVDSNTSYISNITGSSVTITLAKDLHFDSSSQYTAQCVGYRYNW